MNRNMIESCVTQKDLIELYVIYEQEKKLYYEKLDVLKKQSEASMIEYDEHDRNNDYMFADWGSIILHELGTRIMNEETKS